jgi:hypothetical protein
MNSRNSLLRTFIQFSNSRASNDDNDNNLKTTSKISRTKQKSAMPKPTMHATKHLNSDESSSNGNGLMPKSDEKLLNRLREQVAKRVHKQIAMEQRLRMDKEKRQSKRGNYSNTHYNNNKSARTMKPPECGKKKFGRPKKLATESIVDQACNKHSSRADAHWTRRDKRKNESEIENNNDKSKDTFQSVELPEPPKSKTVQKLNDKIRQRIKWLHFWDHVKAKQLKNEENEEQDEEENTAIPTNRHSEFGKLLERNLESESKCDSDSHSDSESMKCSDENNKSRQFQTNTLNTRECNNRKQSRQQIYDGDYESNFELDPDQEHCLLCRKPDIEWGDESSIDESMEEFKRQVAKNHAEMLRQDEEKQIQRDKNNECETCKNTTNDDPTKPFEGLNSLWSDNKELTCNLHEMQDVVREDTLKRNVKTHYNAESKSDNYNTTDNEENRDAQNLPIDWSVPCLLDEPFTDETSEDAEVSYIHSQYRLLNRMCEGYVQQCNEIMEHILSGRDLSLSQVKQLTTRLIFAKPISQLKCDLIWKHI